MQSLVRRSVQLQLTTQSDEREAAQTGQNATAVGVARTRATGLYVYVYRGAVIYVRTQVGSVTGFKAKLKI